MKKWYWALGTIGIIIVILIITLFILPGAKERSVSNLYIIPAGTFSVFHETNVPTEQDVTGNISGRSTEILHASETELKPYLYPAGPVCGYGVSNLGVIEIALYDQVPVNRSAIDEIYHIINTQGKALHKENTPVLFIRTPLVESDRK